MREARFTPGPWRVEVLGDGFDPASEGLGVCDGIGRLIAHKEHEREKSAKHHAIVRANMELIAAAPDLYEALSRLASSEAFTTSFYIPNNAVGDELKARLEFARAALAKVANGSPQATSAGDNTNG